MNWNPDGRFLAISEGHAAGVGSGPVSIYKFDASSLTRVAQVATGYVPSLSWSPNGSFLATAQLQSQIFASFNMQIYDFNGSMLTLIPGTHVAPNRWSFTGFQWSPDGKYLAGTSIGNDFTLGYVHVYTIDYAPTTTPQSLTNSMVLGDSAKGSAYDAHLRLQPGASVNLTGKMFYDNIDGMATT
jgi:Tol biopolymer transport system component